MIRDWSLALHTGGDLSEPALSTHMLLFEIVAKGVQNIEFSNTDSNCQLMMS